MASTTLGALKQEYAEDQIRVASMGAIRKPDGSVRPVHDGTHGVRVNQEIQQLNLLAVLGPAEVAWMVRQAHEQKEPPFAITGDVAAAHRLVRIRRQDWSLLACRAESESPTLFINKVGTFGISSASLWWSRLFGIVGRMVGRAMLNRFLYQFAFVDDLHANFFGPRKHVNALLWLVLYLMEAPYLFDEENRSQWASASAELLATLAALFLFGHLEPAARLRHFPVVVPAVTDNRGNESLARKQSTTKWPLMLINIQLSHLLMKAMLKLDLQWRPREENQDADDLTNQRFQNFDPDKRVDCKACELPLGLLNKLWLTKNQFDSLRRQMTSSVEQSSGGRKRPHEKSAW
ncbi:unnamed protein product [Symbiodinium pilosum]|uniref:Uncharacterized protein n=1 Tax=Symbiodinium pilosum TaxID=2952 RepID=A0A812YM58_SYMPI|nr:unnamed protein product [Symbiodinium pilosum]